MTIAKPIKTTDLWHPINGKLVHIVQIIYEGGYVAYYTDGEKEEILTK